MKRVKPYDWQMPYIEQVRLAMREFDRVLFQAPTGFGKTMSFTYMFQRTQELERSGWVVFHLREIGKQVAKRFKAFGIKFDWIASGMPEGDNPIKLVMAQTVVHRLQSQRQPDWIVEDECHHATASTWGKIRDWATGSQVLGCTATPARADGKPLALRFDHMVHGPQRKYLIEVGQLARPIVYYPENKLDLKGIKKGSDGDFEKKETSLRLEQAKITGDLVEHYSRICPGAKAIVFDITVADAIETAAAFRAAGYRFKHIDGSMSDDEREIILREYETGSLEGLVNVNLFLEGVDIPDIRCVIWRRPTQSENVWSQGNGRGMRACEGKTFVYILDHVGNIYRHGAPHADRYYDLIAPPAKRQRETEEGEAGGLVRCKKCHHVFEPGPEHCPECGAAIEKKERQIIEVAGQLVLLTDEKAIQEAMIREKQKRFVSENIYKCRKRQDFIDLALEAGRDEAFGLYLFKRYLIVTAGKRKVSID